MLGGGHFTSKSQVIERGYYGLPPHIEVEIFLKFYKLNGNGTEKLKITIDDKVFETTPASSNRSNICDAIEPEGSSLTSLNIPHTIDDLMLKIEPSTAFFVWGIELFQIRVKECDSNCLSCMNDVKTCISCAAGLFLDVKSAKCVTMCPEGSAGEIVKYKRFSAESAIRL
jgi:hypothetical protein